MSLWLTISNLQNQHWMHIKKCNKVFNKNKPMRYQFWEWTQWWCDTLPETLAKHLNLSNNTKKMFNDLTSTPTPTCHIWSDVSSSSNDRAILKDIGNSLAQTTKPDTLNVRKHTWDLCDTHMDPGDSNEEWYTRKTNIQNTRTDNNQQPLHDILTEARSCQYESSIAS